jgi:predicted helicase
MVFSRTMTVYCSASDETYSAVGWVLDRYKERTPKDPTIRERFNTCRCADYKEPVIDLLRRVCTVSVETINIIRQMPG